MGTEGCGPFFAGGRVPRGVKLTTYINLLLKYRTSGAIPVLSPVYYYGMHRDIFTFFVGCLLLISW